MWRGREGRERDDVERKRGGERERDEEGKRGGREREMMWSGREVGESELEGKEEKGTG